MDRLAPEGRRRRNKMTPAQRKNPVEPQSRRGQEEKPMDAINAITTVTHSRYRTAA
jgi:hypothetical protein